MATTDNGAGGAGAGVRKWLEGVPFADFTRKVAGTTLGQVGALGDIAATPTQFAKGYFGAPTHAGNYYEQALPAAMGLPYIEGVPSAPAVTPSTPAELVPNTAANYGPDADRSANILAGQRTVPIQPARTGGRDPNSTRIRGDVGVPFTTNTDPRLLRELYEARFAAAERGDWDAVNRSYGPGGLRGDWVDPSTIARTPEPATIGDMIQMKWDMAAKNQAARIAGQQQQAAYHGMQARAQAENYASEAAHRKAQEAGYGAETELKKAQAGELAQKAQREAALFGARLAVADPKTPEADRAAYQRLIDSAEPSGAHMRLIPAQLPDQMPMVVDQRTGKVTIAEPVSAAPTKPTPEHIKTLVANKSNPDIRAKFVAQFGEAAAKQALGGSSG